MTPPTVGRADMTADAGDPQGVSVPVEAQEEGR